MRALGNRVSRLEGGSRAALRNVAVVATDLPPNVTDDWALSMLSRYGGALQVLGLWVIAGEPAILLNPTPAMSLNSEAERVWLSCLDSYPHVTITSGPDGVLVHRFDIDGALRQWITETERELAS